KKVEKPAADPLALITEKQHRHSSSSKAPKYIVEISESSEDDKSESETDSDIQEMKHALSMLTKQFQKKFYKKPSNNKQRFSSGSHKYES
ncbi:hypothetical protein, partial [Escherichia coli]|uniref:hypothetical protein n=1 Tax=Escherichia coli TaxID=562 RepID=UPI001AA1034F